MFSPLKRIHTLSISLATASMMLLSMHAANELHAQTLTQSVKQITTTQVPYFSDPYYVPFTGATTRNIWGTTPSTAPNPEYLTCSTNLSVNCASESNWSIDYSAMQQQAGNVGAKICSAAGAHPFQYNGSWIMAITFHVNKIADGCPADGNSTNGWSVISHALPTGSGSSPTPPTSWVADNLIVGSFNPPNPPPDANYNGRYVTNAGQLYLVYIRSLSDTPRRDGIVAQAMQTPTNPTGSPVLLLQPNLDSGNPLNSETYFVNQGTFKLVETGNITLINGKYALAYSVGAFNRDTYKAGVAWCDTFLPAPNKTYRKVTITDTANVWGGGVNSTEVHYLLQSQKPAWPNFLGNQVKAPGVPTIAKIGPSNNWVLMFAGYASGDAPMSSGTYMGSHRRPFFLNLNVNVDGTKSVSNVSQQELDSWISVAP